MNCLDLQLDLFPCPIALRRDKSLLSVPTVVSIIQEQTTQRKKLIKKIQKLTRSKLITYTANPNISPNFIDHNDVRFFSDLLQSTGDTDKLILMLNSPGGEANMAEKLAKMCRDYCKNFRVLVPNYAMSAATMIALASDAIMMGYLSSIGPIDPQIRVVTPRGDFQFIPAQSYIDSFRGLVQQIIGGVPPKALIPSLQQLNPPIIDVCLKAIESSKKFAEEWLSRYMLKNNPEKAKEIAEALSDVNRWLSHGKNIDRDTAEELGLVIEKIPKDSELWLAVWDLFNRQEHFLNTTNNIKIFENEKIQLNLSVLAMIGRPPPAPAPG